MNLIVRKQERDIIKLYEQGMSVRGIARKLNMKKNKIVEVLEANNIKKEDANNIATTELCVAECGDVQQVAVKDADTQTAYINNNFNVLVEMIERYKANNLEAAITDAGNNQEIVIELPIETRKDFKTSIRVNDVIWEQFKEFCKNNRDYTQKDMVSMALAEYMQKYE